MTHSKPALAFDTGSSIVVDQCQVCGSTRLDPVLFLGYLPPVNGMPTVGTVPSEQPSYPALLLRCDECSLAQLGLVVDPKILFPPEYPYTSGTTRILRTNFAEMYKECTSLYAIGADELVVDIASNDGTLLQNWVEHHRVLGIEPTDVGHLAVERGVPTEIAFFTKDLAVKVREEKGPAKIITICNAFAHIEDVHSILDGVLELLDDDGIFISESHYLVSLLETLQYDTIYHEHLRYYSLTSLNHLLSQHGLEVIHARRIPTHGGSVRVYAARTGRFPVRETVGEMKAMEHEFFSDQQVFDDFRERVVRSKLELYRVLADARERGDRVYGIGAPSRASTMVNYLGLDDSIIHAVMEIPGSHKIGKYMPGTLIPVADESALYRDQPELALLFSWHIAEELIPKLAAQGFEGDFLVPLPKPRIVPNPNRTPTRPEV